MTYGLLRVETAGGTARVTLNRPEVHNAFNAALIEELRACFAALGAQADVRAIVLAGAGPSFCAGADVQWMQQSLHYTEEQNRADAQALATMLRTIDECPRPVIARVHGACLGGGVGLAAVADLVIAAEDARFGLTEVKLGIVPAVISPFVLAKVNRGAARALFLTGERFGAERAFEIGLVTTVCPADMLDAGVEGALRHLAGSSPAAIPVAKELWRCVPQLAPDAAFDYTTGTIARLRVSEEGQEGLRAFLEKRKPGWSG